MIALRFNEAGVKIGELAIDRWQGLGENLKFLATPSFNQRAANQMIDYLMLGAVPNRAHQAGDPFARMRLREGNPAPLQERQDKLKMLKLFDRDRVQFIHAL